MTGACVLAALKAAPRGKGQVFLNSISRHWLVEGRGESSRAMHQNNRMSRATLYQVIAAITNFTGLWRRRSLLTNSNRCRAAPIKVTDQALREKLTVEPVKVEMVRAELPRAWGDRSGSDLVVHIYPPVTGHLVKIWVQLGDAVKEGQLLATLTAPDFMTAQDNFLKARSALNLTQKQLRREQALWDAKIPQPVTWKRPRQTTNRRKAITTTPCPFFVPTDSTLIRINLVRLVWANFFR